MVSTLERRRPKVRSGERLTYFEKENLLKFLKEYFAEEIWDALGYDPKIENIPEIWDEHCFDLDYYECKRELLKKFSLYLRPERKLEEMLGYAEVEHRQFIEQLKSEIERMYGTTSISELYKKPELEREICEYVEYELVCRRERELVDWNSLFIERSHPLYSYIKEVYGCVDLYEKPVIEFTLQEVDNQEAVYTFTEQVASAQGFKPVVAGMWTVQLRAPLPLIYLVTIRDTKLKDKVLLCVLVEREEWSTVLPLTHKLEHYIGVLTYTPAGRPAYYAFLY
jgi:hypothetical protein